MTTVAGRCKDRGNADRGHITDTEFLGSDQTGAKECLDCLQDQAHIRVLWVKGLGDQDPDLQLVVVGERLVGKEDLAGVVGGQIECLAPFFLLVGPCLLNDGLRGGKDEMDLIVRVRGSRFW